MELQASGWVWSLTGSHWLYPTRVRQALTGMVSVPADFVHLQTPVRNDTGIYVLYISLVWQYLAERKHKIRHQFHFTTKQKP